MKIDDFLKEEMNWSDRDLEYRPVIGYLKVTELLQKWGKKQLLLHDVSQQRELLEDYQHFIDWNEEHDRKASTSERIESFIASNCG